MKSKYNNKCDSVLVDALIMDAHQSIIFILHQFPTHFWCTYYIYYIDM